MSTLQVSLAKMALNEKQTKQIIQWVFAGVRKPTSMLRLQWEDMLRGLDPGAAFRAARLMAVTKRTYGQPQISDFWECYRKVRVDYCKLTAAEALELTRQCAKRYGLAPENKMRRNEFLGDYRALRKFLRVTGLYAELCECSDERARGLLYHNFRKAWDEWRDREETITDGWQLDLAVPKAKELLNEVNPKLLEEK